MFTRVVSFQGKSGAADRAVTIFRERVVDEISQIPGFLTAQLLWSDDSANALAIATYDSREAMEADTPALRDRLAAAREIMVGPPSIAVYEVKAHGSR